uniref:Putative ovule protein n=1 Tax=Solanum chacoense TaxID=4108 RepID=A0A0V0HBR5_SOLCH
MDCSVMGFLLLGLGFYTRVVLRSFLFLGLTFCTYYIAYLASHSLSTHGIHLSYRMILEST